VRDDFDCSSHAHRGRPPRAEAAARPFLVRLSPAERDRVERAARVNRQPAADFARDALVTAASESLDDDT
jgi:CxxC motif-containing protein (DUF1111 family)